MNVAFASFQYLRETGSNPSVSQPSRTLSVRECTVLRCETVSGSHINYFR
jgi:hypothetical protein